MGLGSWMKLWKMYWCVKFKHGTSSLINLTSTTWWNWWLANQKQGASIRTYLQHSSLASLLWQVLRFAAHLKGFGIWSNYSRAKNEERVSMGVSLLLTIQTWRSCCICRSISAPQWILFSRTLADQHDCVDFQPLFLPSRCLPSLLQCSRNNTKCKKLWFEEAIKTEDS